MMITTALAASPVPAVDLSSEATFGPWEAVIAVAIAAVALIYLLRSYGLIGRRKQPGCAQCASGGGCAGQGPADVAKSCAAAPLGSAPDQTRQHSA
ncbi:MAG: hypothetical protein HC900_08080 [Methylacidiphilales bacterium]|nr:hypothetical protein [Candidatus Methylacidiphilales bacterium]